jgi:hypothetical protein
MSYVEVETSTNYLGMSYQLRRRRFEVFRLLGDDCRDFEVLPEEVKYKMAMAEGRRRNVGLSVF